MARGRKAELENARTRGITLEGHQWERLEEAAEEWGVSVSAVVRRVVDAVLVEQLDPEDD